MALQSVEQIQLTYMQGALSQMSEIERKAVQLAKTEIREIVDRTPEAGAFAMAMIALELQVEATQ